LSGKLSTSYLLSAFLLAVLFPGSLRNAFAGEDDLNYSHIRIGFISPAVPDTTKSKPGTISSDTVSLMYTDTIKTGISYALRKDTLASRGETNAVTSKVKYGSADSIRMDLQEQKVFLYGDAKIDYEDISLEADYVEINFKDNVVFATGLPDSTGKLAGLPVFKQGDQSFKSREMRYNFKTKKGIITDVFTQDAQGYLHGKTVKRLSNEEINISHGSYTTCDLEENPHYEFRYNKSKVVPNKRIVTGPAYLVVENVPTPLFIPFGWFPAKTGQRSGIVVPTYGESTNRGFYLESGGYYWAINNYLDFQILGDVYSKGSWALKPGIRYRSRYHFDGSFNFSYAINILGVKETPNYSRTRDFSVRWSHRQDPKARPLSTFSADVNIVSQTFNKFNPVSTEDYLSNTFRSSIAYQTSFGGLVFLTLNASQDQNTNTHILTVTLPEINLSVNRFYPFRSKNKVGRLKWYDNITMNYNMNARNTVTTADSLFFKESTLKALQNGIKHTVPVSSSIKLLKFFNWTNSLNFQDRMYFQSYMQHWSPDTLITGTDTIVGYPVTDTVPGFNNVFDFSFSSGLTTKIYGIFRFGPKSPINAIRHVLTPTISFSYTPNFGSPFWGYYDSYTDGTGKEITYSKYNGAMYGSPPGQQSGRLGVNLANNLEMKVRSRKDTITGVKKIVLIDNFTISFYYDFAKDSLNWSPLILSGRTKLFKSLDITYRSEFDPYILDSTGTKNLNKFEWDVNKRLLRLDQTNWNITLTWSLRSTDVGKNKNKPQVPNTPAQLSKGTEAEIEEIKRNPSEFIDWKIPWDVSLNYSFNYTAVRRYPDYQLQRDETIVQSLGLNGNVSITPKWKVGFVTGWDFVNNELTYTSLSIYRDLHCWEMRFNWVPMGFRKSWNFSINAKASLLQDLKLTKKKDFRDY
jgi:lipopolysaccharide assembly outer membrane protein LptD (OstA)